MKTWPVILALAAVAACAHDPTSSSLTQNESGPPRMIGLDSLREVDGVTLPCCGVTGGTLTFYFPTHVSGYVATPGGASVPRECVIGVPNGEILNLRKGIAVSADGVTIPILPCTTGEYRLAVQPSAGGGEKVLSSGTYTWAPDSLWHSVTLTLFDSRISWVTTQAHGDTIAVTLWRHSYVFQVINSE